MRKDFEADFKDEKFAEAMMATPDLAKSWAVYKRAGLDGKSKDISALERLNSDTDKNPDFAKTIDESPELVHAWLRLQNSEVGHLSTNPDALKALSEASDSDAVDAMVDATQSVEKSKPTWDEIKALFKRGNDFNKKARLEYEFNEIVLKNGKRLDSYVPGVAIVSRKATTLSEIKLSTFEGYLKELTTKYKKGEALNSTKLPKGELEGEYKLEIPSSNRDFYESNEAMKELAKRYNVEVIFLDE